MTGLPRSAAALALRRCLQNAWLPAVAGASGAFVGASLFAPQLGAGATAAGAMSAWLHLPLFVLAIACACTAVVLWPAFADRRPGADWLWRLQRGPLRGCGGALAGALLAQLLLTVPITTGLASALGAPATASAWYELRGPAQPLLNRQQRALVFEGPRGTLVRELHLRPLAALPGGDFQPSRLVVRADGELLTDREIVFRQTGEFVLVPFAPRAIQRLELELVEGTVPLFFPAGSATLVGAAAIDTWWNGLLLALLGVVPTFVALAMACLCGAAAALPTVLVVVISLLFVQTIGGAGPMDVAVRHLLRGHWLPATGAFRACLPSLAVGAAAMIGAMLLRLRPRR